MSAPVTYADGTNPSILIIGAGVAGLCAAIQLKRLLGIVNFVIFEKARDIGGTWLANSYPGCQVDAPAWAYSYSFEKNPGWSKLCPDRDEMLAYFQRCARKYDIYRNTRFGTEVKSLVWSNESKTMAVTTLDCNSGIVEQQEFHIVIIATGLFREPTYPPEFTSFSGTLVHSARWDPNIDLKNRVVGVVGNGPSSVQVIPAFADEVKQLVIYIRHPNHTTWKFQSCHSRPTKWILSLCPFLLCILRGLLFLMSELLITAYDKGTLLNKTCSIKKFEIFESFQNCLVPVNLVTHIRLWWGVKDKSLRRQLTPRHPTGFKRPSFTTAEYYQTYNRPDVRLNCSPIIDVTGQNITTADGREDRLDVLILCTGFKLQDFFAPMCVTGADGVDLMTLWKSSRPDTYYGVTCHAAPNLLFLLGPNVGCFHGTNTVFLLECQVQFLINTLRHMMCADSSSFRVTQSAQDESMSEITAAFQRRNYILSPPNALIGSTWLVNENGYATAEWPKSSTCYWLRTRRLKIDHFCFTPRQGQACTRCD